VYAHSQPNCVLPRSFFEGRFIPDFHPESLDYEQWWDEQIKRCLYGWSDGGYSVTNVMYYHLNFKKINLWTPQGRPDINFPMFSFEDQELFNDVNYARSQGKGLILVTGRGFGKSFDAATIAEHEYTFYPASEIIVSASIDEYAKKLWEKIQLGLNSQPDDIRHNFLQNTTATIQSGEKIKEGGKDKVVGYMSIIRKVIYDKDPGKTRGSRPNIHIFEEVGSWVGSAKLIDCYKMTEASWWRGSRFTCFPFLIGTGGEMETGGSEDAKEMFYNPEAYNLMAFEYKDKKIGKFFPAYKKFGGYWEDSGISDENGAKEFLDKRRESKKTDDNMFKQETMEFPFEPEEAFQTKGDSFFPVAILEQRFADIHRNPEYKNMVEKGDLIPVIRNGKIIDVNWEKNDKGPFEILEHPVWRRPDWSGGRPLGLYVGGIDSFDAVLEKNDKLASKKRSSGSEFIYKRFWKVSETGDIFVAKITQRTDDASEFYDNTVKLNMYYDCQALVEYTMKGIFSHYINHGYEHLLYKRPRLDSTVVKESVTTNTYGLAMPKEVKVYIIKLLGKYAKNNPDKLFFLSQIVQMLEFEFESSAFDEVMASSIALIANEDMHKISVVEHKKQMKSWPKFVRDSNGRLVFN
jgi:hypothetical protein